MANKMTNRKALAIAINALHDWKMEVGLDECLLNGQKYSPDEVIAKLEAMAAALDNKSSVATRKPTKTQIENMTLRAVIMDYLIENPNLLSTCTDLRKNIPALNDMNSQKISSLMQGLVVEGKVMRIVDKGKSLFQLY